MNGKLFKLVISLYFLSLNTLFQAYAADVPDSPSVVSMNANQLEVKHRRYDGSLKQDQLYVIKGVQWQPASIWPAEAYPPGAPFENDLRRNMWRWAPHDFPRIQEAGFNTLRLYIDPGLTDDPSLFFNQVNGWPSDLNDMPMVGDLGSDAVAKGKSMLDDAYRLGLKVILQIDNGNANLAVAQQIVTTYKDHPAILFWMIGDRVNRPTAYDQDGNPTEFMYRYATFDEAAQAIQTIASWVQGSDSNHPVAVSLDHPELATYALLKSALTQMSAVDLYSLDVHLGKSFGTLFHDWQTAANPGYPSTSNKPLFIGGYGVDTWHYSSTPGQGYPDLVGQVESLSWQMADIQSHLAAHGAGQFVLGGVVKEWSDAAWKTKGASPLVLDAVPGYPIDEGSDPEFFLYPDGVLEPEWFGLTSQEPMVPPIYPVYGPSGLIAESESDSASWDIFSWGLPDDLSGYGVFQGQADYIGETEVRRMDSSGAYEYYYSGLDPIPVGNRTLFMELWHASSGGGWGIFRTQSPVDLSGYAGGQIKFNIKISKTDGSSIGADADEVFFKFEDDQGPDKGVFFWLNDDATRNGGQIYFDEFDPDSTLWQELSIPISALSDGHDFIYQDQYGRLMDWDNIPNEAKASLDLSAMKMVFSITSRNRGATAAHLQVWLSDIRFEADPVQGFTRTAKPALETYRETLNSLGQAPSAIHLELTSYMESYDYTLIAKNGSTLHFDNSDNYANRLGGVLAVALDGGTGQVLDKQDLASASALDAWIGNYTGSGDYLLALAVNFNGDFISGSSQLASIGATLYTAVPQYNPWVFVTHLKDGVVIDSRETQGTGLTASTEFILALDHDGDGVLSVLDEDDDNDGLLDTLEVRYGTDVLDPDSDDDGILDGMEVNLYGSNPRNVDSQFSGSDPGPKLVLHGLRDADEEGLNRYQLSFKDQETERYIDLDNDGGQVFYYQIQMPSVNGLTLEVQDSATGAWQPATQGGYYYNDVQHAKLKVILDRALLSEDTTPEVKLIPQYSLGDACTVRIVPMQRSFMVLSPAVLDIPLPDESTHTSAVNFILNNKGGKDLSWEILNTAPWISVPQGTGTLAGGQSVSLNLVVQWNQLDADRESLITIRDTESGGVATLPIRIVEVKKYSTLHDLGQVDGSYIGDMRLPGLGEGAMNESMGDVNGDGYPDIFVSAVASRRGYLFYGGPDKLGMDKSLIDEADVIIHSDWHPNRYNFDGAWGYSNAVGDIDGDGYDDIIVGDITGGYFRDWYHKPIGAVSIFFGSADFAAKREKTTTDDRDLRIVPQGNGSAWHDFGCAVATGDLDGDGKEELIMGTKNARAQCWVMMGRTRESWDALPIFRSETSRQVGDAPLSYNLSGIRTTTITTGDLDNDGYEDLIFGTAGGGGAYVFYGKPFGWASLSVSNADAIFKDVTNSDWGAGTPFNQHLLSARGDVNGDGYADLLISTSYGFPHENSNYLFFGGPNRLTGQIELLDADVIFKVGGWTQSLSSSVMIAKDMNGDGLDEVVIGAWRYEDGGASRAVVFLGRTDWEPLYRYENLDDQEVINDADISFIAEQPGDTTFRYSMSSGDFDQDGFNEILLLHEDNDEGGSNRSQVYVISGGQVAYYPQTLTFTDFDSLTESQPFYLSHALGSQGNFSWDLSTSTPWISNISTTSGVVDSASPSSTITLTVNREGMDPGQYNGEVLLQVGGSNYTVPVTMQVGNENAYPMLTMMPSHLYVPAGSSTTNVQITNTGNVPVSWSIAATESWVTSVTPANGSLNIGQSATLNISVNDAALAGTVTSALHLNWQDQENHSYDKNAFITYEINSGTDLPSPVLHEAIAGTGEVQLSWSPVSGVSTYWVDYGNASGSYTQNINVGNVTRTVISGLTNGVAYFFVIRADDGSQTSDASNELASIPLAIPAFTTVTGEYNRVTLNWGSVPSASSYRIEYGFSSGNYSETIEIGAVTSYSVTGLTNGTPVYFRMIALDYNGGASHPSTESTATPTAAGGVPAPYLQSAFAGTGQVTLQWIPVSGTTNYYIKWGLASGDYPNIVNVGLPNSNELSAIPAPTLPVRIGSTYYATLQAAYDAAVANDIIQCRVSTFVENLNFTRDITVTLDGGYSGDFSSKIGDTTVVGEIIVSAGVVNMGNLIVADINDDHPLNSITPGDTTVSLSWDPVAGATSYNVLFGMTPGIYTTTLTVGDVTNHTVTGLTNNTLYFFVIAPVFPEDATVTEYTVTGLTDGVPVYFVVTAADNDSESPVSNENSAIPLAPTTLTFDSGDFESAHLSWDGVTGATGYRVRYGNAPGQYSGTMDLGNGTTGTVTGLQNYTTYYFAVAAYSANGLSDWSNEVTGNPQIAELIVDNTEADVTAGWTVTTSYAPYGANLVTAIPGTGSETVTWTPQVLDTASYDVYWWNAYNQSTNAPNAPFTINYQGNSRIYSVDQRYYGGQGAWVYLATHTFAAGTSGSIQVSDEAGGSRILADAIKLVPNRSTPVTPTMTQAEAMTRAVRLKWTEVSGADGYMIKLRAEENYYTVLIEVDDLTTDYIVTGIDNNRTYHFAVMAFNGNGHSQDSNELSATPQIIEDNTDATVTGTWTSYEGWTPYGDDVLYKVPGNGSSTVVWRPTFPSQMSCKVYWWNAYNQSTNAPKVTYKIQDSTDITTYNADQRYSGGQGSWNYLGTHTFDAGTGGYVELTDNVTGDRIFADAMMFELNLEAPTAPVLDWVKGDVDTVTLQWNTLGGAEGYRIKMGTGSGAYTDIYNVGAGLAEDQLLAVALDTPTAVTLTTNFSVTPTYTLLDLPEHGILSGTAPNLVYTPETGFEGGDRFTFMAKNGADLSNIATVQLLVAPMSGVLPVIWTQVSGVTVSDNTITKTTGTTWGNSGASSTRVISGDGYVEWEADVNDQYRMCGLSVTDPNTHYNTIHYAAYAAADGFIHVYEGGTHRGQYGGYNPGDIIKVERTGSTINYYLNGTLQYTSALPSYGDLVVDAALHDTGSQIVNAVVFGASLPATGLTPVTKVQTLIDSLTTDQDYYFVVEAYNVNGFSAESNERNTLTGIIIDNLDAELSGSWSLEWQPGNHYGIDAMSRGSGDDTASCIWRPNLPAAGAYGIYIWNPWTSSSYATNAPFTVYFEGGQKTYAFNQRSYSGQWQYLGTHAFAAGTTGYVELLGAANSSYVLADAVLFVPSTMEPEAPTLDKIYANDNEVTLEWSPVDGGDHYRIRYGTASGNYTDFVEIPAPATNYILTGLTNSQTYYFVVEAFNINGTSPVSNELSETPEILVDNFEAVITGDSWNMNYQPGAHYGIDAVYHNSGGVGDNKITWRPNIPSAGSYKVYHWNPSQSSNRATNAPFTITYDGGQTTYPVNERTGQGVWTLIGIHSFAAGTTGYVELTDQANSSYVMADAVKFVPNVDLPTTPVLNPMVESDASLTLEWSQAEGAKELTIHYGVAPGVYTQTAVISHGGATSHTLTGLVNGTTYYCAVEASNENGSAPLSNEMFAQAGAIIVDNLDAELTGSWNLNWKPGGEYGVDAMYRNSGGTGANSVIWRPNIPAAGAYAVYVWNPSAATNRATNAPFTVYYNGGSQTYPVNQQINQGVWTYLGIHSFVSGTTGYVEVTDIADSTYVLADAIKFLPAGGVQPEVPVLNSAVSTSLTSVSLDWSVVTNHTGYGIKYGTQSGVYTSSQYVGPTAQTFEVTGLLEGPTYYFAVVSVNANGESPYSNERSVQPGTIIDNLDAEITGAWNLNYTTGEPYGVDSMYRSSGDATAQVIWRPNIPVAGSYEVHFWNPSASSSRATDAPFDIYYQGGSKRYAVNQRINQGVWTLIGTHTFDAGTTGYVEIAGTANSSWVFADAIKFVSNFTSPVAPSLNRVMALHNKVRVDWTDIDAEDSYKIKYGTTSGVYSQTVSDIPADTVSYEVTGLNLNQEYFFVVVGVNTHGDGAVSNELSATPEIIVDNLEAEITGASWVLEYQPGAQYGVDAMYHASGGVGDNKVVWRPDIPADGSYSVYYWNPSASSSRATNAPFTIYYNGTPRTYLVNERINQGQWTLIGTHHFTAGTSGYVELTDQANSSLVMADAIKWVPSTNIPDQPTITEVEPYADKVQLGWTDSDGRDGYYVKVGTTPGNYTQVFTVDPNFNYFTVPNLAFGTPYYFVVSSFNSYGESANSPEETATIDTIAVDNQDAELTGAWIENWQPGNQFGVDGIYKTPSDGSSSIRWRPDLPSAGSYEVYYWIPWAASNYATNAPYTVHYEGNAKTYLVNQRSGSGQWKYLGTHTFAAGTTGYVELDDHANSTYVIADAIQFVPVTTIPQTPYLEHQDGEYLVTLEWTPSDAADGYEIQYGTSSGSYTSTVTVDDLTHVYSISDLPMGPTYYFTVSAFNTNGFSATSNEVAATPGVIVDNLQAELTGAFTAYTTSSQFRGDSLYVATGTGDASIKWQPILPVAGDYTVYTWLPDGGTNSAWDATFTVASDDGSTLTDYTIDQRLLHGRWEVLGTQTFAAGKKGYVELTNLAGNSYLRADAVKFVPNGHTVNPSMGSSIIIDNSDAEITGLWWRGWRPEKYYQADARWKYVGAGDATITWRPTIPTTGLYDVYCWIPNGDTSAATNASFTVTYGDGSLMKEYLIDQRGTHGWWQHLGSHTFNAGTTGSVTLLDAASNSWVGADAVLFVPNDKVPLTPELLNASPAGLDSAMLEWSAVDALDGYRIKFGTTSGSYTQTIDIDDATTSHTVTGLVSTNTYYFVVMAYNVNGNSSDSVEIPVTPMVIPDDIIIDNQDPEAEVVGSWSSYNNSSQGTFYAGNGFAKGDGDGSAKVRFRPNIQIEGDYKMYYWMPSVHDVYYLPYRRSTLTTAASFTAYFVGGSHEYFVNERSCPVGQWVLLGSQHFVPGQSGYLEVSDKNGPLYADAIKFEWSKVGQTSPPGAPTLREISEYDGAIALNWDTVAGASGYTVEYGTVSGSHGTSIAVDSSAANDQTMTITQDTPTPVTLTHNYSGGTTVYTIVTDPLHGTLSGVAPNLTYSPDTGFFGYDSFTFAANNGATSSNVATVSLTVENASGEVPVIWTRNSGVSVNDHSISKTAGTAWGNAGASSQQIITGDGYVEWEADVANQYRMCGLDVSDPNTHYNTIDFAAYAAADGVMNIYENGTHRGAFGAYAAGDKIKVMRQGDTVTYYLNDVLQYTSLITSAGDLVADAALYTVGSTITNAVVKGATLPALTSMATSESTVIKGLTNLTKHYFVVTAQNVYGSGEKSNELVAIPGRPTPSIIDNLDPEVELEGTWTSYTGVAGWYGDDSLWADLGDGSTKIRWRPDLPLAGNYNVYYWLPNAYSTLATNVPLTVHYSAGGNTTTLLNQRTHTGGQWVPFGIHYFDAGTTGYVEIDNNTNAWLLADAIKFEWDNPGQLPDVPVLLNVEEAGPDVSLQWTAVAGASGYRIHYGEQSGVYTQTILMDNNVTQTVVSGLSHGPSYHFAVSAVSGLGDTALSNELMVIPGLVVDNAAAELVGTWTSWAPSSNLYWGTNCIYKLTGDGSASVTWRPDLPVAGGYRIYFWNPEQYATFSQDASFDVAFDGGTASYTQDLQATAGEWTYIGTHSFLAGTTGTVTLTDNATGKYVVADAIKFVPYVADSSAPTTPQNLTATTMNETEVLLSWQSATDNVGVAGYNIYRDASLLITVAGISVIDNTVLPGQSYNYTVSAVDGDSNESGQSTLVAYSSPDLTAPSIPLDFIAVPVNESQINLSWTASTDNVNVIHYNIFRGGTLLTQTAGTSYSDTGLTLNTNYAYRISAEDAAGNTSLFSSEVQATPIDLTPPTIPGSLTAIAVSYSQIDLSWTNSTDNVGLSGYQVYRDGALLKIVSGTSTSDLGLTIDTTYSYQVRAVDMAGNPSGLSNTAAATTLSNMNPVITTAAITSITEGFTYTYDVNATDADNDTLTYTLTTFPTGMSIDSSTGIITWIPGTSEVGTHPVTVDVTDGEGGSASQSFTLVVTGSAPLVLYTDAGLAGGSDVLTWFGGTASYNGDFADASAPEGAKSFETTSDNWAGWGIFYTSGPTDLSGYGGGELRFWIRTSVDLKVELQDDLGRSEQMISSHGWNGTNNWQEISIPIGVFGRNLGSVNSPFMISSDVATTFYVDQVRWMVATSGNQNPVIVTTPITTAQETVPYGYDVDATDADGDTLTYSLTENPTGMAIHASTGIITWTPEAGQAGVQPVTIRVDDGNGGVALQSYNIDVTTNAALVIYADAGLVSGSDVLTWFGGTATYNSDFNDVLAPEGIKSFETTSDNWAGWGIFYTSGPADLSGYGGGALRFWVRTSVDLKVELQDDLGRSEKRISSYGWDGTNNWQEMIIPVGDFGRNLGSVNSPFMISSDVATTFNVDQVRWISSGSSNQYPVISTTPVTVAEENVLYTYDVDATDADGDTLTYSLTTSPTGMTIDASTGIISWTPEAGQAGTFSVALQVADGNGGLGVQNYNLEVSSYTSFMIYADVGLPADTYVFTWLGGTATFNGDYVDATAPEGIKSFETSSDDWAGWGVFFSSGATDISTYSEGELKFWVRSTVELKVEIEDSIGKTEKLISNYGWDGTNNWQEITMPLVDFGRDLTQIKSPFMISADVASIFFVDQVRWIDSGAANQDPVITTTAVMQATENTAYTYDVDATDADGDTLNYALTTHPTGMIIHASTGIVAWTPGTSDVGTHPVTIEVTDGNGGSASQSYTLTVSTVSNQDPVITTTAVTQATENTAYTYDVDATDADGDTLNYTLTTHPTGMVINASTGIVAWTPGTSDVGTHPVTVEVTDGNGGSASQSYTLTVINVGGGAQQMPWSSNATGTLNLDQSHNYTMGYRFTPQIDGVVLSLGGFFNGTKSVYLWEASTETLLAQTTVSSANHWVFTGISPVTVRAGDTYIVAAYLAGNGASYRSNTQTFPQTYGDVRIEACVYSSGNEFPVTERTTLMYGQVDIGFTPTGNYNPVITGGPTAVPSSIQDNETSSISITATDPEGSALSYAWSASMGTLTGTGATVTFTPDTVTVSTTVTVTVDVMDADGGVTQATLDVMVNPQGSAQEETPWQSNENGNLYTDYAWDYTMGYNFTPTQDGAISQLGGFFNGTKTVYLWETSTRTLLAQVDVTSSNNWAYESIGDIAVTAGVEYTVATYLANSGGSYRTSIQALPQTYTNITITSCCFSSGNAFPETLRQDYMYGQVDVGFIGSGNQSPVISDGPTAAPSVIQDNETSSISITATDPEGSALSYAWSASMGTLTGTGATVTFTPDTVTASTTVTVTVDVMDADGGVTQATLDIMVNPQGSAQEETPWQSNENGNLYTDYAWDYTMGYNFTPTQDGAITQLGGYFNGTKTVYLWETSTRTLLAQVDVTSSNSWVYESIGNIGVTAGVEYTVATYLANSGGSFRTEIQSLPQTYTNITIMSCCYSRGNTFPETLRPDYMYGQVDVGFIASGTQNPVITDGPTALPSTIKDNETSSISITATDPEGSTLSYAWSASMGTLTGTGANVTFTPDTVTASTTVTVTVDVMDADGGVVNATLDIVVNPQGNAQEETPWQSNENGDLYTDYAWDYTMGYNFTPTQDGAISQLGGFFNGTKTVYLWETSTRTLLAQVDVTSSNSWAYEPIGDIGVTAGVEYTVATYLADSGGSYRTKIQSLPQTYSNITILSSCYSSGDTFPVTGMLAIMYGQVDVGFIPGGNQSPVISDGPTAVPSVIQDNETSSISITATDPEGSTLSYAWSASMGTLTGTGATVIFTPDTVTASTTVTVTVDVMDADGGVTQATLDIMVNPQGSTQEETPWQSNENGYLYTNNAWNFTMGYNFTPTQDGAITQLGGYFNGTKTVYLWETSTRTLLAQVDVTSSNDWAYESIGDIAVTAGVEYTVATYLAGSGGSYRSSIQSLPQTYGPIIINSCCYASGDTFPVTLYNIDMYGQVDIAFSSAGA